MSGVLQTGYKQTEIGVIPDDWEGQKLEDGISLLSGQHVLAENYNTTGEGIPYITGPADFPNGVISHTKFTTKPTTLCCKDDILVTVKGSGAGTIVLADGEYCISRQLMAVRVFNWDKLYIFYHLLRDSTQIGSSATGLIPGLSRSDILLKQIPYPSLPEQRAIAAALSDVDALIQSQDALIAKKRDLKQATMQQLLTGKQRLPGFDGEWEMKRLGDMFQFFGTANNSRADLLPFGTVGYIHYGDIHTSSAIFLDCEQIQLPRITAEKVLGIPLVQDGDLIMADASEDYAGIGKSIEVKNVKEQKIVAGLHTFLLRGYNSKIAIGFRGYLQFIPSVKTALIQLATGISVYGISKNNVRNIEVLLPDVNEQTAIAGVLSDMDAEIAALEAQRDKTRVLKQGMMQELLTGKTRLL